MADRKTPMQRYRDVADRELLRRVAEEVMSDCWDAWCSEAGDSRTEVDLDAIIDRVLSDAPQGEAEPMLSDSPIQVVAPVDALHAAHARGVAEERERIVKACGDLLVRESVEEFDKWDEGFQHAMLTIIEDVCDGSREGLPIVTTMRRGNAHARGVAEERERWVKLVFDHAACQAPHSEFVAAMIYEAEQAAQEVKRD